MLFDEARERGLVLGEEDERGARDVGFERDRREAVAATDGLRDLARGDLQHLPDAAVEARARGRCARQLLADDRGDRGGADVRDHATLAIDDLSARRRNRNVARDVRVGERDVAMAGQDLEVPEAKGDDREQNEGQQAEQLDAPAEDRRQGRAALDRAFDHARESGLRLPVVEAVACGRRSLAGSAPSSALRVSA